MARHDPYDRSTGGTEATDPPAGDDDLVLAERQEAQRLDREARASGAAPEPGPGDDPESSYPTEESQGATQPGPHGAHVAGHDPRAGTSTDDVATTSA